MQIQADEVRVHLIAIPVVRRRIDFVDYAAKTPQRLLGILVDGNIDGGIEHIGKPRHDRALVNVTIDLILCVDGDHDDAPNLPAEQPVVERGRRVNFIQFKQMP